MRNSLHECMASGEPIIESEAFDPMQEAKHTAVHHLRRTSASGQPESGLSKSHGRVGRRGTGELRVSPHEQQFRLHPAHVMHGIEQLLHMHLQ